jgi:hypothetical protein
MYSIQELPSGRRLPQADSLITSRPRSWQGMVIDWSSVGKPVPVFLAAFPALPVAARADHIFLFGTRYNLAEALIGGQSLAPGYFVEFIVFRELSSGDWATHRLLQQQSVTFSDDGEARDYVSASSIAAESFCRSTLPRWKWDEALWPTHQGKPMTFLGEVALPDTNLTRALLTWDMSVFLFDENLGGRNTFKIVTQESDLQAAVEHYSTE